MNENMDCIYIRCLGACCFGVVDEMEAALVSRLTFHLYHQELADGDMNDRGRRTLILETKNDECNAPSKQDRKFYKL